MKMMVCYDGSDACKAALRVAQEYAPKFNAAIHVVASVAETSMGGDPEWVGLKGEIEGQGGVCVEEAREDHLTDGESLVGYAERNGVDALFIGVEKVSKVGKLLFGSTAQYVILAAPCPVISVKAG